MAESPKEGVDPFDLLSVELVVKSQDEPSPEHPFWAPVHVEAINHAEGLLPGETVVFRTSVDYADEQGQVLPPLDDDGEWTGGHGTGIVAHFGHDRAVSRDTLPYAPPGTADFKIWTTRVLNFTSPTRRAVT